MGEETCKGCRSWEEKIYWAHFQCMHFSQFLRSGFDKRLAIPETFARHLRKKFPDTVSLKGPGGAAWKVGLTTYNNTLFFNHGWQEFVKDHSLEENDILIFKYNGEANFDVLMFDMRSMCEKAASYFVKKCESTERSNGCQTKRKTGKSYTEVTSASPKNFAGASHPEEFTDNYTDTIPVERPSVSQVTNTKICGGTGSTKAMEEDVVLGSQQDVSTECDTDAMPVGKPVSQVTGKKICRGIGSTKAIEEDIVEGSQQDVSTDNDTDAIQPSEQPLVFQAIKKKIPREIKSSRPSGYWRVVDSKRLSTCEEMETEPDIQCLGQRAQSVNRATNRRRVTEEEKLSAMRLAVKVVTENGFLIVMKPSHVGGRFLMSIPSAWLVEHLPVKENQDVILRYKLRTWQTRFFYHQLRKTGWLAGEWKKFVLDNKLHEFDVCVFEPVDLVGKPMILNVAVFRVVEDEEASPVTSEEEESAKDHA